MGSLVNLYVILINKIFFIKVYILQIEEKLYNKSIF